MNINYTCKRYPVLLSGVLMVVMLGFIVSSAMADDSELHQVVDDVAIYL